MFFEICVAWIIIGVLAYIFAIFGMDRVYGEYQQDLLTLEKKIKNPRNCPLCKKNLTTWFSQCVTCSVCDLRTCRSCADYNLILGEWTCHKCVHRRNNKASSSSSTVSRSSSRYWYDDILSARNSLVDYSIPVDTHVDRTTAARYVQLEEFISRHLNITPEKLNATDVGKVYVDAKYDAIFSRYHEVISSELTDLLRYLKSADQVRETVSLRKLKELMSKVNMASKMDMGQMEPNTTRNSRHGPTFYTPTYPDILSTAILNRIIIDAQVKSPKSSISPVSVDSAVMTDYCSTSTELPESGSEKDTHNWVLSSVAERNISVQRTSDEESINDTPGGGSLGSNWSTENLATMQQQLRIEESIEEITTTTYESDESSDGSHSSDSEDDLEKYNEPSSPRSNIQENVSNWQHNWLFKRKKELLKKRQKLLQDPVTMLVPNPTDEVEVMIGDEKASDLEDDLEDLNVSDLGYVVVDAEELRAGEQDESSHSTSVTITDVTEASNVKVEIQTANVETTIVNVETPIVKVQTPIVNVETPIVKVESPIVKVKMPVEKVETPIVKVETPIVKVETPIVKVETPIVKAETPIFKVETPISSVETPLVKVELPIVQVETTIAKIEETPFVKSLNPVLRIKIPIFPNVPEIVIQPVTPVVTNVGFDVWKQKTTNEITVPEQPKLPPPQPSEEALYETNHSVSSNETLFMENEKKVESSQLKTKSRTKSTSSSSSDSEQEPQLPPMRIAEREKEKWNHPVAVKYNPYAVENLNKRLKEKEMILLSNLQSKERVDAADVDKVDDFPIDNRNVDKFRRDYYVHKSSSEDRKYSASSSSSDSSDFYKVKPEPLTRSQDLDRVVPPPQPAPIATKRVVVASGSIPDAGSDLGEITLPSVRNLAKKFSSSIPEEKPLPVKDVTKTSNWKPPIHGTPPLKQQLSRISRSSIIESTDTLDSLELQQIGIKQSVVMPETYQFLEESKIQVTKSNEPLDLISFDESVAVTSSSDSTVQETMTTTSFGLIEMETSSFEVAPSISSSPPTRSLYNELSRSYSEPPISKDPEEVPWKSTRDLISALEGRAKAATTSAVLVKRAQSIDNKPQRVGAMEHFAQQPITIPIQNLVDDPDLKKLKRDIVRGSRTRHGFSLDKERQLTRQETLESDHEQN